MKSIKENILNYLSGVTGYAIEELDSNEDLISSGVIDSLMVINLTVFIEEQYKINLINADFEIDNFRNVKAIENMIISALKKY